MMKGWRVLQHNLKFGWFWISTPNFPFMWHAHNHVTIKMSYFSWRMRIHNNLLFDILLVNHAIVHAVTRCSRRILCIHNFAK